MHRHEFLRLIEAQESEKLVTFLFSETKPKIILFESFIDEKPHEVWVGDYLGMLLKDDFFPVERFRYLFQLKDLNHASWFVHSSDLHEDVRSGIGRILERLVCKNIFTPTEGLEAIFCTALRKKTKFSGSLAKQLLKTNFEFLRLFYGWMTKIEGMNKFAKVFLEACEFRISDNAPMAFSIFLTPAMENDHEERSKFFESLINMFEVFSQDPNLCQFILKILFSKSKKPIFPHLYNLVEKPKLRDQLSVILYNISTPDPSVSLTWVIRSIAHQGLIKPSKSMDDLLISDEMPSVTEHGDTVFASIREHHPEWVEMINGKSGGSGSVYPLLLSMIHDALKTNPVKSLEEDCSTNIAHAWMGHLFYNGSKSSLYMIGDRLKDERLWDTIFEIFKRCGQLPYPNLKNITTPFAMDYIFTKLDAGHLLRLLKFLMTPSAWVEDEAFSKFLNDFRIQLYENKNIIECINSGNYELNQFFMAEVFPLYKSNSQFISSHRAGVNLFLDRAMEHHFLEMKWDQLSTSEIDGLRKYEHPAAMYIVFKYNQHHSPTLDLTAFFTAFPKWQEILDDPAYVGTSMRDLILFESCIGFIGKKTQGHIQSRVFHYSASRQRTYDQLFSDLIQSPDIIGILRHYRRFFTIDRYRLLLDAVSKAQTKNSHFVLLSILEGETNSLTSRLVKISEMRNCPVLVRLKKGIQVYGFYSGAWSAHDLDQDELKSLEPLWAKDDEEVFIAAGDTRITKEVYDQIITVKGHDFELGHACVLFELGQCDFDQANFKSAADIFDQIPLYRISLPIKTQCELVEAYLKLYKQTPNVQYLYAAIRHARLLGSLDIDDVDEQPVVVNLLKKQGAYFQQLKVLGDLFVWDPFLNTFDDDALCIAAMSLQRAIIQRCHAVPADADLMMQHSQRILKWLNWQNLERKEHALSTLSAEFAKYIEVARPKLSLWSFYASSDDVFAQTQRFYEVLQGVMSRSQLEVEEEEKKGIVSGVPSFL